MPVSLGHAGVVHHEEVHLEVVGARALHLVVLCKPAISTLSFPFLVAAAFAAAASVFLPVPMNWIILTQQPSQTRTGGMSRLCMVWLNGSWHRQSFQLLHSKQSILCPAESYNVYPSTVSPTKCSKSCGHKEGCTHTCSLLRPLGTRKGAAAAERHWPAGTTLNGLQQANYVYDWVTNLAQKLPTLRLKCVGGCALMRSYPPRLASQSLVPVGRMVSLLR